MITLTSNTDVLRLKNSVTSIYISYTDANVISNQVTPGSLKFTPSLVSGDAPARVDSNYLETDAVSRATKNLLQGENINLMTDFIHNPSGFAGNSSTSGRFSAHVYFITRQERYPVDYVAHVVVEPENSLLIGGRFNRYNSISRLNFLRMNADGSIDEDFYTNLGTNFNDRVLNITKHMNDGIVVVGNFTSFNGTPANGIVRLYNNGIFDANFATNTGNAFVGTPNKIITLSDNSLVIGGEFSKFKGVAQNNITKLNYDGTINTDFVTNSGTGLSVPVLNLRRGRDDDILITMFNVSLTGWQGSFNGLPNTNAIVRLNSTGILDAAFANAVANSGATQGSIAGMDIDRRTNVIYLSGGKWRFQNKSATNQSANNFIAIDYTGNVYTPFTTNTNGISQTYDLTSSGSFAGSPLQHRFIDIDPITGNVVVTGYISNQTAGWDEGYFPVDNPAGPTQSPDTAERSPWPGGIIRYSALGNYDNVFANVILEGFSFQNVKAFVGANGSLMQRSSAAMPVGVTWDYDNNMIVYGGFFSFRGYRQTGIIRLSDSLITSTNVKNIPLLTGTSNSNFEVEWTGDVPIITGANNIGVVRQIKEIILNDSSNALGIPNLELTQNLSSNTNLFFPWNYPDLDANSITQYIQSGWKKYHEGIIQTSEKSITVGANAKLVERFAVTGNSSVIDPVAQGYKFVSFKLWGAGGGGGGGSYGTTNVARHGGGGGGGGACTQGMMLVDSTLPLNNNRIYVVVGEGGAGGAGAGTTVGSGTQGSIGGSTYFFNEGNTFPIAYGGGGGAAGTNAAAATSGGGGGGSASAGSPGTATAAAGGRPGIPVGTGASGTTGANSTITLTIDGSISGFANLCAEYGGAAGAGQPATATAGSFGGSSLFGGAGGGHGSCQNATQVVQVAGNGGAIDSYLPGGGPLPGESGTQPYPGIYGGTGGGGGAGGLPGGNGGNGGGGGGGGGAGSANTAGPGASGGRGGNGYAILYWF